MGLPGTAQASRLEIIDRLRHGVGIADPAPSLGQHVRDTEHLFEGGIELLTIGVEEALGHKSVDPLQTRSHLRVCRRLQAPGQFTDDGNRLADRIGPQVDLTCSQCLARVFDALAEAPVKDYHEFDWISAIDLFVQALKIGVGHVHDGHQPWQAVVLGAPQIIGQPPEEFRGDLADDFLGFPVDDLQDEFICPAVD